MLRFIGYHGTTSYQAVNSLLSEGPREDMAFKRGREDGEYGQLGPGLYATPDINLALGYTMFLGEAGVVEVYITEPDDAPLTVLDADTLSADLAGEYRLWERESPWVTDLAKQTWALEYDLITAHHSRTTATQIKVSPKAFDKVVIKEYGHGAVSR